MEREQLLQRCSDLVAAARKAGADQAEAAAAWSRSVETNVENGDVHSVQTDEETTFGLRVLVGGRLGFVTANDSNPRLLAERAAEAVAQARVTPADETNDFPEPQDLVPIPELHDPAVAELDAVYTTAKVAELVERVRSRDERVRIDSGSVGAGESRVALVSSKGIEAYEASTSISSSLFGMAVDGDDIASFDYDGEHTRDLSSFEDGAGDAADRFTEKCLAALGAQKGESFRGVVVLSPEAVSELLLPVLLGAVCADAVRKGRSKLADKVGAKIAADCITLLEDGTRAGSVSASAFDREGVPPSPRAIVNRGVLGGFLYNHYEARAAGGDVVSTGNASGSVSTLPGIGPSYLEMAAGRTPAAELLAPGETALWLGRFSGSTNGVSGDFSGVAKGSFLLRGEERRPLREVLVAGNVYDALLAAAAVSVERRLLGGSALLPSVRLEGLSVTAG